MIANRSVPPCTVIPVLIYRDPGVAAEWLCAAFGFRVRLRIGNHRIQMKVGDGCLVVADGALSVADSGSMTGHLTMVRVTDIDAHCERARAAGAEIAASPKDHPYGERQYNAVDFAGHRWAFTQSIADVAPESWGGVPVDLS